MAHTFVASDKEVLDMFVSLSCEEAQHIASNGQCVIMDQLNLTFLI